LWRRRPASGTITATGRTLPPVSSSRPRTPRHGRTRMTFRASPTRSTALPTAPTPAWRPSLSLRFRTNCTPVDFDLGLFVGTAAQSHHRCRRGTIACANHRTLSLGCHPSLGTGIAEISKRVDRNSFYRPARPCVLATGAGGDEAAAPTFRAAIRTAEAKFADAGGLATRIRLLRTTQHRAARRIVVSSSQLLLPAAESSALRRRIAEMIKGLLAATGLAGLAACFVVQGAIAAPIAPTAAEITAPQVRSLERVYYYNGRHYAYHYNNRYYAHRVYRHGHWHYY
jgi:hypothetical protein